MAFEPLKGVKIIVGISGGIAAYKSVEVIRTLVKDGAEVTPIMTKNALRFIGDVTVSALSSHKVLSSLYDSDESIPHTASARECDAVVVVPATARIIGSYANGIPSDLLSATLIASKSKVVLCPAMHEEMWTNRAVVENVEKLRGYGVKVIEPDSGLLAGGDIGMGRLPDPSAICDYVEREILKSSSIANLNVVVTAGGTREPIDPVRFISNRSSGKQGFEIAKAFWLKGANVTLIATFDTPELDGFRVVKVETADEMAEATIKFSGSTDVFVMTAAVADFKAKEVFQKKLKRKDKMSTLDLAPTTDILAELVAQRDIHNAKSENVLHEEQILIGFAAETGDLESMALEKLKTKNVDVIVANDVSKPGVGFSYDTNSVLILTKHGNRIELPLMSKKEIAFNLVKIVEEMVER